MRSAFLLWGSWLGLGLGGAMAYASFLFIFARCEAAPCSQGILLIPFLLLLLGFLGGWRLHAFVLRHKGND